MSELSIDTDEKVHNLSAIGVLISANDDRLLGCQRDHDFQPQICSNQ